MIPKNETKTSSCGNYVIVEAFSNNQTAKDALFHYYANLLKNKYVVKH